MEDVTGESKDVNAEGPGEAGTIVNFYEYSNILILKDLPNNLSALCGVKGILEVCKILPGNAIS